MPRRREMNRGGSNFSRSSIFSPTPMKTIGAFTSATADRAPPPFAVPSSFVTMTPVIPTASWNAFAWGPARARRDGVSFLREDLPRLAGGRLLALAVQADKEDPFFRERAPAGAPQDLPQLLVDDPDAVLARAHAGGRLLFERPPLELLC